MYGYDRIPETQIADRIPPQYATPRLDAEMQVQDLLATMGFQEVVTYRLTSPEREARARAAQDIGDRDYIRLANPIGEDRVVLRQDLLASLLEVIERNARSQVRMAIFEIGPVFLPAEGEQLPHEAERLAIAMRGPSNTPNWQTSESDEMDFFSITGVISDLWAGLHLQSPAFEPSTHEAFHPGKCASVLSEGEAIGTAGVVHPMVAERYDSEGSDIVAAEIDLRALIERIPDRYPVQSVPAFPPVLEDIAFVVDQAITAEQLRSQIHETGQPLVAKVSVFDLYQGDQVGEGKKSLAFSLVYQAEDRTLTDDEVAAVRGKIVKRLEDELGAKLRDF